VIITRTAQYFLLIFLGILGMLLYLLIFRSTPSNLFWIAFTLWFLWIWQLSSPYKNFDFKMHNLPIDPKGEKSLFVSAWIGHTWEISCTDIDKEKGVRFSVSKIKSVSINNVQKEEIGGFFLLPSSFEATIQRLSGHLELLVIDSAGARKEKYLEKIKSNSFALMLHFAAKGDKGSLAVFEVIKKTPSWKDSLLTPFFRKEVKDAF